MLSQRQQNLASLSANGDFDVIVVGGGVNGTGLYRELALQGLRVLLVERNDFCSGCSAAPSRMIHGGLRYLENGEFGLVRESLAERDALLRNAPHMVRPLPTVIPITSIFSGMMNSAASLFGRQGKPTYRGALPIKLGLSLYDWVTRNRRLLPRHHFNGPKKTRSKWPQLTSKAYFSAVYYDAWISHPERLCIELLRDVEQVTTECIALNYSELRRESDGFVMKDTRTGVDHVVNPSVVVNATGAWLDSTNRELGGSADRSMVSGTKGSHLIIDNEELVHALAGHMTYFENTDGRVCIAFPYNGCILAGSTDIRVKEASRVRCEPEETEYILTSLRLVFPDIEVKSEDIVFSFSGIRPLPTSDHEFTGRISRGHFTKRLAGEIPQFCMIGGKWTTFRAFAEQTADEILAELGHPRRQSTIAVPIGGGNAFPERLEDIEINLMSSFGISATRARHLAGHYGTSGFDVMQFCSQRPDDSPISWQTEYSAAEIAYLLHHEYVETLSDIVLRRTSLAITGAISTEIIERLAVLIGDELGLSADSIDAQRQTLIDELADFHGVTKDVLNQRNDEVALDAIK